MKELEKEEHAEAPESHEIYNSVSTKQRGKKTALPQDTATDNMILFTVLNTASLQLIPTTAAALRLQHGSAAPMEILPAVWAVSAVNLLLTVTAAKIMGKIYKRVKK